MQLKSSEALKHKLNFVKLSPESQSPLLAAEPYFTFTNYHKAVKERLETSLDLTSTKLPSRPDPQIKALIIEMQGTALSLIYGDIAATACQLSL